jgi:hypothetical protein
MTPLGWISVGIAVLGMLGMVVGVIIDPSAAAFSYLAAFMFALSIGLGSLFVLMITHISKARWFILLRRLAEGAASTLPLSALLFVPVALGVKSLYPWARSLAHAPAELVKAVEHKHVWLSVPFWLGRAALYFAVWILLSELLFRTSLSQERLGARATIRMRTIAAAGMWPLALTLTFAGFDWILSLEPTFSSTILGIYLFAGSVLAALSVLALLGWWASARSLIEVGPSHFHALGRLMLTFTIFWAYSAFVQFLIVWMADIPREVVFFIERTRGGWLMVSVFLIVGHFVMPFFFLLSARLKRDPSRLGVIAIWILACHFIDLAWLILPAGRIGHERVWQVIPALLMVIGASVAFAALRIQKRSLLPAFDPELAASTRYHTT